MRSRRPGTRPALGLVSSSSWPKAIRAEPKTARRLRRAGQPSGRAASDGGASLAGMNPPMPISVPCAISAVARRPGLRHGDCFAGPDFRLPDRIGGPQPPAAGSDRPPRPQKPSPFSPTFAAVLPKAQKENRPGSCVFHLRRLRLLPADETRRAAHPEVVRQAGQFVCIEVDLDREPAVCKSLGIRGYPTILCHAPGRYATAIDRIEGRRRGFERNGRRAADCGPRSCSLGPGRIEGAVSRSQRGGVRPTRANQRLAQRPPTAMPLQAFTRRRSCEAVSSPEFGLGPSPTSKFNRTLRRLLRKCAKWERPPGNLPFGRALRCLL